MLKSLPAVLAFSCQRFRCDKTTNWQRSKVTDKSAFPLVLDMAPFIEGSSGSADVEGGTDQEEEYLERQRAKMTWIGDAQLGAEAIAAALIARHGEGVQLGSITDHEVSSLLGERVSPEQASALRSLRGHSGVPLSPAPSPSPSSSPSPSPHAAPSCQYELFAVINHRGTAHSGHYFAYIRDCEGEGKWSLPADLDAPPPKTAPGGGLDFLSEDPLVSGYLKTPRGYVVNAEYPHGLILTALQKQGKAEATNTGHKLSLRTDQIFEFIKRTHAADSRNSNVGLLLDSKKGAITDTAKLHPEFFAVTGSTIATNGALVEVLDPRDYALRVADSKRRLAAWTPAVIPSPAPAPAPASAATVAATDSDAAIAASLAPDGGGDWSYAGSGLVPLGSGLVSGEGDDEWGEAKGRGKNKKGKNRSTGGAGPIPGGEAKVSTAGLVSGSGVSAAAKMLAHEVAGKYFGNFFEFDDSNVTPMPLANLEKAFEGRDSAYLLVYRRVGVTVEAPTPNPTPTPIPTHTHTRTRTPTPTPNPKPTPSPRPRPRPRPTPPAFWADLVERDNERIHAERRNFDRKKHSVSVSYKGCF